MNRSALAIGIAVAMTAVAGCNGDGNSKNGSADATASGANAKTIAAGLPQSGKFMAAAKASGLDQTLGGQDSYTVLVPDDSAFDKLPAGTLDTSGKPDGRAQLTGILTYHILPGVVLADDIGKAIDNSKGKPVLATMGGGTLTASREGGDIVLTDGKGQKAKIEKADEKYSNGVVHHIDSVLTPAQA